MGSWLGESHVRATKRKNGEGVGRQAMRAVSRAQCKSKPRPAHGWAPAMSKSAYGAQLQYETGSHAARTPAPA